MTVRLPFEQTDLLAPAPLLRQLQGDGVIHPVRTWTGDRAWLVTGYEDVRRLLDDDRLGRSHPRPEEAARLSGAAFLGGPMGNFDTEMADHARMRSLQQPHFSPRRMRALRPRVEELTDALLDEMAEHGPPVDLHQALALPLPIQVICELLGVPYADRDQFRVWTEAVGDMSDGVHARHGISALYDYGRRLVSRKRREPGGDYISRLCAAGVEDDEAARMSMGLLFAGHETTVAAIGRGTLYLWSIPAGNGPLPRTRPGLPPRWRRSCAFRAGVAASPDTPDGPGDR